MRLLPVVFRYQAIEVIDAETGESVRRLGMIPLARYERVCKRQYVEDQEYPLAPIEARSRASHSHFFAALQEGFDNLPEGEQRWPTSEHFRKWALCMEGFCTEKTYDCQSHSHAMRLAAMIRGLSEFAVIVVRGNMVKIFEAESQSAAAMNKERFEDSKRKVLDRLASMIGVKQSELKKARSA
jgi:hypothetical protein